MRFLVSGILGNLWIRSTVGLMLWTQGRLLRGGGFLSVPYDFLFLHGTYGMPVFRQMGINEQQKFSDLDLISRLGWRMVAFGRGCSHESSLEFGLFLQEGHDWLASAESLLCF